MFYEDTTEKLKSLKMASLDVETRRSENYYVTQITQYSAMKVDFNPFKDEAQTALFKAPVRTAL
jgi:hypothetical protein